MVEKLLGEFNLEHLRNINANSYLVANVRRLQIARTLINNPKVIFWMNQCWFRPNNCSRYSKLILRLQSYGSRIFTYYLTIVGRIF